MGLPQSSPGAKGAEAMITTSILILWSFVGLLAMGTLIGDPRREHLSPRTVVLTALACGPIIWIIMIIIALTGIAYIISGWIRGDKP